MNQVQIRNSIVDSLSVGIDDLQESMNSIHELLSNWKNDLEGIRITNETWSEDNQTLLSFLAYIDETKHNLSKTTGQLYFILGSDIMETSRSFLDKVKKPKLIDLNKTE